jgi:hypothetical protein
LEPQAPPLMRDRAAPVFAAPGLLLPVLALSLTLLGVSGTASAAEPQPDAAPQAPAVAPDPAPGTTDATPRQQSPPVTPVQAAPQVPTASQQPAAAPPPAPTRTAPKAKSTPKSPSRARRDTRASRSERTTEPADPSRLLRIDSFLPGVQGDEDSPSHLVLLAAAALLALVMASGSLLSVTTRVWRSPLR